MAMETLEKFMVFLDERRIAGDIISRPQKIQSLSVNSSYSVDSESHEIRKAAEVKQLQEEIRAYTYAVKKSRAAYRGPVFLKITFNQVLKRKKDGSNSMFGVMDVDNILKATIDSLNKNVIYDDCQVCGIFAVRKINAAQQSYILIEVMEYDTETLVDSSAIEAAMEKTFHFVTEFPGGISPVSYNALYEVTADGNRCLSREGKIYKDFLTEEYSRTARALGKKKVGELMKEDTVARVDFRIRNAGIRDLDNLLKATIDSLVKTVLFDDRYLSGIFATKSQCLPGQPEKIRMEVFRRKPVEVPAEIPKVPPKLPNTNP